MTLYDTVVIGAGPGGLTAALYLCRFGLKTALVEKTAAGGQMLNTFSVDNYPGYPDGLAGWQLAEHFDQHLKDMDLDRFASGVQGMSFREQRHLLHLDSGDVEAKSVIVCSGASPRKLGLADEERLTGRGVSYCAMCDGMFFRNKVVALVGGGNSAIEEALHLSKLVRKLYVIHRRDRLRADRIHQEKLANHCNNVEMVMSRNVTALHGEKHLTGLTVEPAGGGKPHRLEVDGLFVFIGTTPTSGFLPDTVERDDGGFVVTDCEMRTSVPGLFAAGDVRAKQCRQVVTAVGDGATAAYSAFNYLEGLES